MKDIKYKDLIIILFIVLLALFGLGLIFLVLLAIYNAFIKQKEKYNNINV